VFTRVPRLALTFCWRETTKCFPAPGFFFFRRTTTKKRFSRFVFFFFCVCFAGFHFRVFQRPERLLGPKPQGCRGAPGEGRLASSPDRRVRAGSKPRPATTLVWSEVRFIFRAAERRLCGCGGGRDGDFLGRPKLGEGCPRGGAPPGNTNFFRSICGGGNLWSTPAHALFVKGDCSFWGDCGGAAGFLPRPSPLVDPAPEGRPPGGGGGPTGTRGGGGAEFCRRSRRPTRSEVDRMHRAFLFHASAHRPSCPFGSGCPGVFLANPKQGRFNGAGRGARATTWGGSFA